MFCQCLSNNVFQLIEYPTRLNSCLNLWLCTIVERIINIQVSDSEDLGVPSDHKAITFDVNLSIRTSIKNQQEMFNFKKADFEGLRTALRNDPPENYLDNDSNIDDDWVSWKTFLFDKLGTFIPKRIPRKFVSPPWIDGEVTYAIRKKNSLHKRTKQKGSMIIWERFREKRREVKYLIRSKRMAYLKSISNSCSSDPNRFWSYFNRSTRHSNIPESVELNGSTYSDTITKADAFNTYFTSVFNNDTSIPSDLPTNPFTSDMISTLESTEEVLSALQSVNPSKTPGPDRLHPKILKECGNELASSLCIQQVVTFG